MSYCGECGAQMHPLLTSEFCPNECDRKGPEKELDPYSLPRLFGSSSIDDWEKAIDEWADEAFQTTVEILDPDDGDQGVI